MKKKSTIAVVSVILAFTTYNVFATETAEKTTTCDATNTNKCVILLVGEGTGKLIKTTSTLELE
jgi:hypothetical protein